MEEFDGAGKLKISELAERAKVTKRTIDYYTKLGLLNAERSSSKYRFYDHSSIKRIEFIEDRKKAGLTLNEIKKELSEKFFEEIDLLELRLKINELNRDVSAVLSRLEKLGFKKDDEIKKKISHESLSLIQKLLLLFT
ncbi:MerR family transcriptional regulator [Bacillus swezeyi]|uniref:MerR family transcriptional regulator n=1 Tax=Bacillus swezeyi TaxID=1925020 RepID=UPI002E1BD149|nr:MerR family transcriptional regulator [Bacillus swezeyi]